MITLYSGTPGSGKSLHTASNIKARLAINKPVVCNFPINLDRVKHPEQFTYMDNQHLTPQSLADFSAAYFGNRKVREEGLFVYSCGSKMASSLTAARA